MENRQPCTQRPAASMESESLIGLLSAARPPPRPLVAPRVPPASPQEQRMALIALLDVACALVLEDADMFDGTVAD